jgi:hypothetical protein
MSSSEESEIDFYKEEKLLQIVLLYDFILFSLKNFIGFLKLLAFSCQCVSYFNAKALLNGNLHIGMKLTT